MADCSRIHYGKGLRVWIVHESENQSRKASDLAQFLDAVVDRSSEFYDQAHQRARELMDWGFPLNWNPEKVSRDACHER